MHKLVDHTYLLPSTVTPPVSQDNPNKDAGGTQMSNTILKARLRKRDKDITLAIQNLKLEEGEMADMVRDGFRLMLLARDDPRRKMLSWWVK
jgi:hypothetical protein